MLYSILREDELFFLWKKRLGVKILSSLRYVLSAKLFCEASMLLKFISNYFKDSVNQTARQHCNIDGFYTIK